MTTKPALWKILQRVLWNKTEDIHRATGKINDTSIIARGIRKAPNHKTIKYQELTHIFQQ